jgi:ubiquinone/menaquinone biosynthesis C-methylase UbiE
LLSKKYGCNVTATDIDIDNLEMQKYYLYNAGLLDTLNIKFNVEAQNATKLSYESESFDVVCSISAIEHIPEDGDVKAVVEASRVLKLGGIFIITAPFSDHFSESETNHYHFGYEKRYDEKAINDRITSCARLKLIKIYYINGISENTDEIT